MIRGYAVYESNNQTLGQTTMQWHRYCYDIMKESQPSHSEQFLKLILAKSDERENDFKIV